MNIVQRVAAAVALALTTATTGTAVLMPQQLEHVVILAGMAVLTPEMEGTKFKAYRDQGGVWTICTGHTGDVKPNARATPDECAAYFSGDTSEVIAFLWKRLSGGGVSLLCKVAIADLGYNIGTGALGRSTLLLRAEAGNQRAVASEFMRWTWVDGKDCKAIGSNCAGIVKRREIQRDLCLVGL